jgi:hypothetical protein
MRGMAVVSWLGLGLAGVLNGCGGPDKEAGAGEACFRVADCQLGLVCGPDQKCTDDLTSIDIRPDASSAREAGGGGPANDAASE